MVKSNSVTINVSSSSTPPPSPYTCYVPRCKTIRLPDGQLTTVCEPVAISSNVPCPENNTGGYSTSQEACANNPCGSTSSALLGNKGIA